LHRLVHWGIKRRGAAGVSIAAGCDDAELMIDHRVSVGDAIVEETMLSHL